MGIPRRGGRVLKVQEVRGRRYTTGSGNPTLTADAFGQHACDQITEIEVLEGAANVVARLQIAALPPAFARVTDRLASKSSHGAAAGNDGRANRAL